MPVKQPKINELVAKINEKARELGGLQESVDRSLAEIRGLGERKRKLAREIEAMERSVAESRARLESDAERERRFLAEIRGEIARETSLLEETRREAARAKEELESMKAPVRECRAFIGKAEEFRKLFLEEKRKLDRAAEAFRELQNQISTQKKAAESRQKEMDGYKNYLADFYGKVATYARTAQDILEYVNVSLERNVPIRLQPPPVPVTMENFNKFR